MKQLNEIMMILDDLDSKVAEKYFHKLVLFADYSGHIEGENSRELFCFHSLNECLRKLKEVNYAKFAHE